MKTISKTVKETPFKNVTGFRLFRFTAPILAALTLWAGAWSSQAQILQLHLPFTNSVGTTTLSTGDGTISGLAFNMYSVPATPTALNLITNNATATNAYFGASLDFTSDIFPSQGATQPPNNAGSAPALVLNNSPALGALGSGGILTNLMVSWWTKSVTWNGGVNSGQNPRMLVIANNNNADFNGVGVLGVEINNSSSLGFSYNNHSMTGGLPSGNFPAGSDPSNWMFWAFTYDGTNESIWYGTQTTPVILLASTALSQAAAGVLNLGSTPSINFGNENAKTWDRGFNGWLSDFRFYSFNRSLTGAGTLAAPNQAFVESVRQSGISPIIISSATALPNPVGTGGSVLLSVAANSAVGALPATGNVAGVTVDASPLGGSSTLALAYNSASGTWTNTVSNVTPSSYPLIQSLNVTVTDGAADTLGGAISLVILGPTDVWNGGDFANNNNKFGDAANWAGGVAPSAGYVLAFAGSTQTSVNMDTSYAVSGLSFNSGAAAFTITNSPGAVLTLDAGSTVANNSVSTETLNVPVQLGGASSLTAAAGNLVLGQPVGGSGPLTLAGPATVTLGGDNTYTGNTIISTGGVFTIAPGGQLNNGSYGGTIANSGTFNINGGLPQTNNGVISGAGAINVSGGGPNNGPIVTFTAGNTFTGNMTFSNTYVSDTFGNNNLNITGSGIGNPQTVGQTFTINSNAVLSLDGNNPLGNGSTIEQGTIIINAGGVFQMTAAAGNATIPSIVLNGGTMQAVGNTGFSQQYAALELGGTLTAGGPSASPSLITTVNGGANAALNLLVNATSGQSPWTVNPAGLNPTGAPDLTVSMPLINSSSTLSTNTGLSKSGTGTLLLNSSQNNYTGPTTINAGTFILGDPGLLGQGNYGGAILNNGLFVSSTTAGQTLSGVISGTGTNAVYGSGASLTLTGASTYTGPTIVGAGGTLYLSGAATIANSSSITISNSGTFDVSGESPQYNLGSSQNLLGNGNVNGSIGSSSGSKILPGTDGGFGTLTFNSGLALAVGASVNLDVGTTYNGTKDQIAVGGTLTIGSGDFVHIKAPSSAANLDASGNDYVLITAGSITGSFSLAPAFDVVPVNAGHYSIVTDPVAKQVRLHYSSTLSPVFTSVTATPSTGVLRNTTISISATVTPGAGSVTNVSVSLGAVGGTTLPLVLSATPNVYTNTLIIAPTIAPGPYNLTVSATDTTPLSGAGNLAFTVAASTETWNGLGANQSWDTNANWISGSAPGYVGDSLVFAGTVGTNTVLDQNYTINALTFTNTAGIFTITNSAGDFLTMAPNSGMTNNSANVETLNLPVELAGGVNLKSAAGVLALTQPVGELVAGSGSVTNAGGTNILYGKNTFTGNITVTAGALTIGSNAVSAGSLSGGTYTGVITNSGSFNYYSGQTETFSGAISGAGALNFANGGTNSGPLVSLNNNFSFTGNVTLSNTYVSLAFNNNNGTVTTSPLGNPATSGRTVTVNANAILSFDANGGNELGGGASVPNLGFIINQGGLMQITSGNCVIGPLTLNGGILNIASSASAQYEPFELGGTVTVGGTSPSLITNTADGPGAGLNLTIAATAGSTTFTVASTGASGADLTVAVPLANSGSEAAGASAIGLTKAGSGTMALTDPNNSYTGGTIINAGTLILANPGQLAGGMYAGAISNSGTFISTTAASQTLGGTISGAGLLEVSGAGDALTLTAANSYTGRTLITNGATLFLGAGGSITNSTSITVATNSLLDVSQATSPILGVNQSLIGIGTINVSSAGLGSSSGSVIAPSNNGTNAVGKMTFNGGGGLSFGVGATAKFALGTTYNGANDTIVIAGALTAPGNSIHLKAPSTAVNLDTSGNDYVLMTASSVVGGFASTPIWDIAPLNAANYTIISDPVNNNVRLHYSANLPPTAGGFFNPSTNALRNNNVVLTVNVTNGSSASISSVIVNATSIGGSASLPMTLQSPGVYTANFTIPPTAAPGPESVLVKITDGNGLVDAIGVGLTVVTSKEIWDGLGAGNQNWSGNANWTSGSAPGYVGDSLIFAGSLETSPVMDNNYTISALTFSNTAAAFNLTASGGDVLTLISGASLTNNSASAQIVNVPVQLAGPVTLNVNTNAGNLVVQGIISELTPGAGSITNAGPGTNILAGANNFTGNITVNSGTLQIGSGGSLAGGTYNGNISSALGATFAYNGGSAETFNGVIAGGGSFNFSGGGNQSGPIYTLTARNVWTGNASISNTYVSDVYVDNNGNPPFSGIGNTQTGGQTFTINTNATLSFDVSPSLGNSQSSVNVTFVVNQGGVLQGTAGFLNFGSLVLNGGTVFTDPGVSATSPAFEMGGTLTAGGPTASPSLITNVTGGSFAGLSLLVNASSGQSIWTVNPAGLNPSGAPDLTVGVPLFGAGNLNSGTGLLKAGSGRLLLAGQSVYTGPTTINAGIITLGAPENPGSSGPLGNSAASNPGNIIFGGGTLQYATANGANDYSGRFSTNAGQIFKIDTAGQSVTFASPLISSNGSLTKLGLGKLTLNNGANTYTGPTTVSNGILALASGTSLASSSSIGISAGGTLDVTGVSPFTLGANASLISSGTTSPATITGTGAINIGSRPITINYDGSDVALTVTAGGTLTLNGNAFTVNGAALSPGTYTLIQQASGNVSSSGTYTVTGSAIAAPNTGVISVTGGQVKLTVTAPTFPTVGANIVFNVGGGKLNLSWPAAYLGSTLQSNSIAVNIPADWFNVPGSTTVTNLSVTIGTNAAVFYRLNTP
jgi:fibronectin-binding autotransporter adhesin